MSMHTYIGARYVPRFTGVYDPTQSYEALDVVDNGSGTSYIARKPVPAGTPLTDTDYWFLYGASSGAIVALQNDMIQAQNDIEDLQDKVNRQFIIVTDSYGGRTNSGGKNFMQLFADALGLTQNVDLFYDFAGGAAFYHTVPGGKFEDILTGLSGSIPDHDAITDIIVVGGANDAFKAPADTLAAISSFATYAKSEYKNARISLFPVGLTFSASGMHNAWNTYDTWSQGTKYGMAYAANAMYILRNTDMLESADYCHPSQAGVDAIAEGLINFIQNGLIEVCYNTEYTYADLTALRYNDDAPLTIPSTNPKMNMSRRNGIVDFTGSGGTIGFSIQNGGAALDIPAGSGIKLIPNKTLISGESVRNKTYYGEATLNTGTRKIVSVWFNTNANGSNVINIMFPHGIQLSENATGVILRFSCTVAD